MNGLYWKSVGEKEAAFNYILESIRRRNGFEQLLGISKAIFPWLDKKIRHFSLDGLDNIG